MMMPSELLQQFVNDTHCVGDFKIDEGSQTLCHRSRNEIAGHYCYMHITADDRNGSLGIRVYPPFLVPLGRLEEARILVREIASQMLTDDLFLSMQVIGFRDTCYVLNTDIAHLVIAGMVITAREIFQLYLPAIAAVSLAGANAREALVSCIAPERIQQTYCF